MGREGGENSIVAYAIDARTGEHRFLDRALTSGVHPRCFVIDPGGRLLVAANKDSVLDARGEHTIPASLDVFRIGDDGRLALAGRSDRYVDFEREFGRLLDDLISLFGGPSLLIAHMIETGKLTKDDISEAEEALGEAERLFAEYCITVVVTVLIQ